MSKYSVAACVLIASTAGLMSIGGYMIAKDIKAKSAPPAFTDAERARIFKSQSAYNALAPQWQKVTADMEAVQRMAKDRCGTEYRPDVDKDGEPICVPQSANAANPQAPSTPEKSANTKQK